MFSYIKYITPFFFSRVPLMNSNYSNPKIIIPILFYYNLDLSKSINLDLISLRIIVGKDS